METTKKLSLDDIFGKVSAPASSEAVKSIDDIFGQKEAATPVAPYGTMTDEIRGVSHAPADLIGVSPQPAIIGENELQKNRAGFEEELKSMAGAIQPTQESFKPMSADAFKVGGDVTMPGDIDKPKSLSQTVQSEIDKRWGGNLQSIIDKARSVNPENVNLAEDMESHFWEVMKDKVPSDSFITQEDLDGFKFTRDYSNGDKDIEYSFGHYTYPQEVVNEYVARHNDEVLHNMRFKEEPEYRNEWFLRNVGVTEQAYRDEVAADLENRLHELRKKIVATLPAQHTRGGYAAIGAAANKPSSGASVSIEKIDKALKTVNTLRKNSFGAGLKEGFDFADILTLGVSGIGENVALLNALNKSASGKTLTTSEQALVEAWDIQNEAEEVMQVLGGRSLASNIGRGGAQSLGFITQTVGTGGLASAATKGITRAAAKSALKRVASTGVASKIQEGVRYGSLKAAESLVGAAARTPFMGFTYRNYTDKRLNQFQINERVDEATSEISKYIDKQESSALRDAAHAALESYFESQSEDVGGLIDFGITSFARALPIKQFIRSSVVNGMTGAVKNGAMKWIKESAKIYGLAGEVLSEAYGDAAVNLLTSNTDGWKQMASSEYWWELLGVSSMLSGGFGVVNRAVNSYSGRNLDRQIAHEDNNRRNALSRIEDDMLKKELTEVSLTDDLIERSKMLSSLDWSNFTKEDMANTIDFISAQTRLDVMRESDMESRRLARIMPAIDEVKTLADNGALDEDQSAASLAVIYSDLFRTQENQRALNILTDRIKVAADAGISADEINEILRGAGLTVFNPGDEIETLTGDRAIVDKVLPGAYEVVNNEGGRAVVSFEEVLQNTPEVRQIQQESNQTEGQPESAPENNSQVEQAVESARQEAEVIKNLDDDVIYEATLSDGTPVNIIKGANIVYNNQTGEVDYDASDATVVVRSNDGSKRQISIREIDSIDQAMSVDEALEVATAAATEVVNSQEQAGTPTAEVASTQAEVPSVQEAEAATVEQSSESPANQPEEQPQIPLLKNGEPDYNAMDARMFAEQYVTRFGEGATERIARNNIKASNKTISTIEKQIEDVTDPNKMPALYSKLQDAQATKDKYSAVLEELGLSADESEDNAARIQRKKQENTPWFNKLFPDGFPNVESVILWDIANGNRIRWTNKEVNGAVVSKGLGSHLGLVDSNAERTRRVALIGKDAPTPEEYAEQLPERLNAMGIRFEESELLDKVLDVYASVDTVRKAKEELEKISANIQAEQEGLDYEEEQMRRNYEREQEALRQEAQADVVDEQTEQEQPTNEEIQEEELSIEDEVPFMISGNPLASETTEAVMSSAKNEFEETDDWSLTGWLLPDGTQLSFSEEGGYERDIDHRAIGLAYAGSVDERWKYLQDFEQRGGIRVSMNYGSSSIELSVKPTSAQFSKLSSFIRESGGNVDIDFMDENYNTSHSASYDSVNSSRVLSDIERYFDEGIKPSGNVSFEIAEARRKNKNEAQLLATEAAITALEDAGVEVVNATPEMVEEALQRKDVQMQAVNQKFNEQLDSFTEENANAVIFDLGMPSPMLIAGGVPNKPIRLYGSKLLKKIRKHGFSAAELSELPMALANPIAVFNNYQREGNRSVLIELSTADGNFLVSIDIGAGSDIDFDIVKSVFGKDGDGILNWINKGYLTIVDKEKALAYLRISAPIAEASNKQELDSATKIVENFENPKIEPDNSFSIGSAPVFVSNAKIAVLGIKQEKATPEQWLKMIEKAGGLKAGEDKWIGLSDWLKSQMRSVAKEKPTSITINGVEYKVKELENQILSDIRGSLEDNGFDVDLVGIRLVGSYVRGEQHEGSDIDVIVEYKGNSSEDTLFDVLNDDENRIRIEGVDVDVNPITEGKSGTLDEWEKRNAGFTKRPATLTKQDVLDYINENQIQIEETTYSSNSAVETTPEFKTLQEEFKQLVKSYEDKAQRNLDEYEAKLEKKYNFTDVFDTTVLNSDESKAHSSLSRAVGEAYNAAWVDLVDQYGDDFEIAFWRGHDGIRVDNAEAAGILLGLPIDRPIYHLREDFTTKGLEGNREIALTVPTIEPWNENDEVHFGDAGGGRAIAWVRFGETTDEDGKRVLVIDEIQSKRHQEGREKGYISGDIKAGRVAAKKRLREAYDAAQEYRETLKEKYNWDGIEANSFSEHVQKFTALLTPEEIAERERLDEEKRKADEEWDKYDRVTGAVPEAPFEKNWAELAMKRMLRYAAENGFDKVAWTKGDQQAERYNLSKSIDYIEAKRNENGTYDLDVATVDDSHFVEERGVSETRLSELVGKEIALSIVKETQENKDGKTTIEGDNLRIGGEGMRAFYNQMLPSFMRKYGKKWGATVQDVTLPYVEEAGRTMHSVDVTDSMRESVMQGQPVFYRRPNGTVYGWTNGTTVYLTESGMNPNTPIHEYTHIWADAMRKHNPEGWKSIVKLLKGTPVWNEVMADTNYANIHSSENQVTSEALSRISGRENSAKMEAVAQQMIDENANDTVKKNRARKLLDRMRKALQEFWSWVGKELFGIKNFESIEQVSDRILYDLVSGTDLTSVSSFDTPAAERNEIISKAKANGTYLKAPNGKDTNLTPE